MNGEGPGKVPFQAHVELLHAYLAGRDEIVEQIEGLLNAQRRPIEYLQDRPLLTRLLEDCFFHRARVTQDQARLRGQLQAAHWAAGFKPQHVPGLHNDLVDPAEIMIRAFHLWQRTRWPGHGGRVRSAHTLFNLCMLRSLMYLSMRVCDAGAGGAGGRLALLQGLLDELWKGGAPGQPVFVRDARWLIPLAQSPTTDDLGAYLEVALQVAEALPAKDRIEIQKAHVRINGGHLCSQIRHYCLKDNLAIDARSVVMRTRTSNALDFAIAIQALAPLLEAYEQALRTGDDRSRFELAGAICQGISPDPELFLQRMELLRPYSMIEHVFVTTDRDGQVLLTAPGQRHLRLLQEYAERMRRLSTSLLEDCERLRPVDGACSPYGVIFGTGTNLIEDMALKTLQSDAASPFSLEDAFVDGDAGGDKLAWVNGWRKLPHVDRKVQKLYEYPAQFAKEIFDRVQHTLQRCAIAGAASSNAHGNARTGRLFIELGNVAKPALAVQSIPQLPARYIRSSDPEIVAAGLAQRAEPAELLHDRQEGHFLDCYATPGGWVAILKDLLTEILGEGKDVRIAGLPTVAADTLRLMCDVLVASKDGSSGRPDPGSA